MNLENSEDFTFHNKTKSEQVYSVVRCTKLSRYFASNFNRSWEKKKTLI